MKVFYYVLALGILALMPMAGAAQTDGVAKARGTTYTSVASAAHGYVEIDSVPGKTGINIQGENRGSDGRPKNERKLTNWTNPNAHAVYYFHHPSGSVSTSMKLTVQKGRTVRLRLTILNPDENKVMLKKDITIVGTGAAKDTTISSLTYKDGWYRYDFQCLEGNTYITNIDQFTFTGTAQNPGYVANYLSSPSVHLSNWHSSEPMPSGAVNDYAYMEVMIPKSSDIVGTYCMSLGVIRGYMGIQNDGGSDAQGRPTHDIIFSQWDDGDRQHDPDLPDNLKAATIDYIDDPNANPYTFGGEGTGAGFRLNGYQWYPDQWVKFICNARRDTSYYYSYTRDTTTVNGKQVITKTDSTLVMQQNLLVTAWFNISDGNGWKYLATTRVANAGGGLIGSWYSFMENYNWPTGSWERKAYYRRGFVHNPTTNRWYSMNTVGFGHTDGGTAIGARNDFGQGRSHDEGFEDCFYMRNGGYTAHQESENIIPISTDFTCVDTINLDALAKRVQQAVDKELYKNRLESIFSDPSSFYNKTGWEVIQYSSQEASGEGANGRAAQIIDGNYNNYWHPQWQGRSATLPHTLTVDMKQPRNIGAVKLTMSQKGGNKRHAKSYEIYTSNDNTNYTLAFKDEKSPDQDVVTAVFDSVVSARYFRLKILETYASDGGVWMQLNEVDVSSMDKSQIMDEPTGISSTSKAQYSKGQLSVDGATVTLLPNGDHIGKANLKVYTLQGVVLNRIEMQPQGDVYTASLPYLENGTYILVASYDNGVAALKYKVK